MVFTGINCSTFANFAELLEKSHEEAFQRDRLGQAKSSSILTHNYRVLMGNTATGNKLSKESIDHIKGQIEAMKKKGDNKAQLRLISEVLDGD